MFGNNKKSLILLRSLPYNGKNFVFSSEEKKLRKAEHEETLPD